MEFTGYCPTQDKEYTVEVNYRYIPPPFGGTGSYVKTGGGNCEYSAYDSSLCPFREAGCPLFDSAPDTLH